jgi:hypothetical protein
MKKNWIALALTMSMAAAMLAGCGGGDNQKTEETTPAAVENNTPSVTTGGYSITINGSKVTPGMEQEAMLTAIGEADTTFEAPSCAGEGTDYTFTYGSIEIQTVPNENGVNEITSILIKDDLTPTDEGVYLGGTADDITAAYGSNYTENGSAYTYVSGTIQLQFILEGDEIISIEYSVAE